MTWKEASAGAKAGLKAGDVITGVNGSPVDDPADLRRRLQDVDEGKEFTITSCGTAGDVAAEVCDKLRAARWTVRDEFTPGLGGKRHVDVYIGEETGPSFTDSEWYTTLENARLNF